MKQKRIGRYEAAVSYAGNVVGKNAELTALLGNPLAGMIAHTFGRNIREVSVEIWKNAGCAVQNPTVKDSDSPATSAPETHAFDENTPLNAQ